MDFGILYLFRQMSEALVAIERARDEFGQMVRRKPQRAKSAALEGSAHRPMAPSLKTFRQRFARKPSPRVQKRVKK